MVNFSNLWKITLISFYSIKCLSMEWAPAKSFYIMSNPKYKDKGRIPIVLHTENLPPTQSQN